ncbi:MAG TPA: long-chain fatty acid--CoA ligase [Bacteroidales bacterium]|nr:long-chain fatty acid--CoA ligase [Bacteroidales bacterium]
MEITRIFDLLDRYTEKFPKNDALAGKEEGEWIKYSTKQYVEISNYISYAFLHLGVQKGDTIATITHNRPEWNFLDMGIQQVGAIHVPIYPNISEADYKYIFNHAEIKYVFLAGEDLFKKISNILPEVTSLKGIYTFKNLHGFKHLNELIKLGFEHPAKDQLKAIKDSVKTDDVATLIYTSGTTGIPKGVMLTHANIISNFIAVSYIPPIGPEDNALSFLPLCHVYERMLNYLYQYLGVSIYYAENLGTIADNMKEVKPAIMSCVPRLLEKIYDRIIKTGRKLKGFKKKLFFWAIDLGLRYELDRANGWWYEFQLQIANILVFSKWRKIFGNNIKLVVSGGAALQPRLARIFWAARIYIHEGYGLTETSPVIAVNSFVDKDGVKFGTVGKPLRGVAVKIADDGEILSKGPGLMKGYYKDETLTRQVIDEDGWFHTSDIGVFEPKGQLRITGRKNEIFKTSFGKYVNPGQIEAKFTESPMIDAMIVLGENQKYAAALIVPDFTDLKSWCENKGIVYTTNPEMINHPEVKKKFKKEIAYYNSFFGETEQIKRWEIMDSEWSVWSGELTPTLKIKRSYINEKFKDIINKLFENNEI